MKKFNVKKPKDVKRLIDRLFTDKNFMVFSLGFSPELADVFIKMHLENKKRKKTSPHYIPNLD